METISWQYVFQVLFYAQFFPNDFSPGRTATASLSIVSSDLTLAFKKGCKAPTRWGGHILSKLSHLLGFLVFGKSEVSESLRLREHFKILLLPDFYYINAIILITGILWGIKYIFHSNLPQLPHILVYT